MRSFFGNKRLVLLLAALALGALTVLAISLNAIPFREAQHFAPEEEGVEAPVQPLPPLQFDIPLWKQLVVIGMTALLVILIALLLSPKTRKRLLWWLIRIAIWGVIIYIFWDRIGPLLLRVFRVFPNLGQLAQAPNPDVETVPLPPFVPPQVSPTLAYVISFAFAVVFLLVAWLLYRGWQRYMRLNAKKSLEEFALIARSSLDDLSAGRSSSDVIINCYLRMSDVVAEKRRLRRAEATTPHEFALYLERAGLPGEAVARLTRLFETVRYGDRKSGPKDVREAVSCLETILQYCGEPV